MHNNSRRLMYLSQKKTMMLKFICLPPFFHLSLSVMRRDIYVKDFPRTTEARILKFGTNIGFDYLYCVRDSASSCLSFPLFAHFSFPPITNFITDVSGPTTASLQILYSHTDS